MLRLKKNSVFFKILIIPVIASISMLMSLAINTKTASQNRLLLEDARATQFPLLQDAERNLVLLAKINETLSSAVTTGDDEGLQLASDYAAEMKRDLSNAKLVAPKLVAEIVSLQLEFDQYFELAHPLSSSMVDGSADFSQIAAKAKEMAELYLVATSALEGFRDARLADFTLAIETANKNADDAITYALVVGAAAIILLFGAAIPIALGIRKSIRSVVTSLKDIAEGDGDLTVRLKTSSNDEIGELVFWFNTFVDKLQDVIQQVVESVEPLSGLSSRLDDFVEEVLCSIENQNKQSDNVSQSATEIYSNVDEVSGNAHRATDMANQTVSFAQEGHKSLGLTVSSIEALAEDIVQSATTIGELERTTNSVSMVISVIKSIAEQTNLLALNAAIEAARAGAQGRGFAVVADEVRSLANKTQASTDEIQETISALEKGTAKAVGMMRQSTAKTEECVKNVNEAGRRFEAILEHIEMNRSLSLSITGATDTQGKLTTLLQQHADEISNGAKTSHIATSSLVSNIHALSELSQTLTSVSNQFKV